MGSYYNRGRESVKRPTYRKKVNSLFISKQLTQLSKGAAIAPENEIRKINQALKKTFGNAVTAVREGDTIRVTGSLAEWKDILKACNMAVSKDKRRVHVVNDIALEGAEPIPMRTPSLRDDALDGKHVDVLVIGGGISGTSIARELAKWDLDILLVEKEADFALQASGRNDGEVHPGIDLGKGSLKQKYVLEGNHMYDKVCADLNVPFRRIGQYACFTQSYLRPAVTLLALWRKYHDGVTDVKIVGKEQLLRDNPTMNPDFAFAMYNSSAGIVSPYNLTIAYAENAAQNGVELSLNTAVLSMDTDGGAITAVHTNRGTVYPTVVVNAAGVFADDVAEMAHDRFYSIHPRRGTDTIQDVKSAKIINTIASIIEVNRQALTSHTKGGGLMQTAHGNVLAGPDAVECREKEDFSGHHHILHRRPRPDLRRGLRHRMGPELQKPLPCRRHPVAGPDVRAGLRPRRRERRGGANRADETSLEERTLRPAPQRHPGTPQDGARRAGEVHRREPGLRGHHLPVRRGLEGRDPRRPEQSLLPADHRRGQETRPARHGPLSGRVLLAAGGADHRGARGHPSDRGPQVLGGSRPVLRTHERRWAA